MLCSNGSSTPLCSVCEFLPPGRRRAIASMKPVVGTRDYKDAAIPDLPRAGKMNAGLQDADDVLDFR